MKNGNIRLSEKHGLNPSIPVCYYCGEAKNEVALLGRLPGDEEAPRYCCLDKQPCDKCQELLEKGVMFIKVRDGAEGPNLERLGLILVIRDNALHKVVKEPALSRILKQRVAFVDETTWNYLGLNELETTLGS